MKVSDSSTIVIVGAGPAGLTAALELQAAGKKNIIILEADNQVGGISRTVNYKGNRIDIGGHRFFSKSDWVMNWWMTMLPVQPGNETEPLYLQYKGQSRTEVLPAQHTVPTGDDIMLIRSRISRIYYNHKFFDYPLKLNFDSLKKLGLKKVVTFGVSYVMARINPVKPEKSLEDFLVNRFGRKLYKQFFKEYTEKVWGVPCGEISAAWGAQRIKSLSILSALYDALKKSLGIKGSETATSLIESFMYPKHGPGQMWEVATEKYLAAGGIMHKKQTVIDIELDGVNVIAISAKNEAGELIRYACDCAISTMPIKDLVQALPKPWSPALKVIAEGLEYRDFITVGLLYPRSALSQKLDDNWIYIQEPGVQVGRVQVFNNWSPYLVADPETVWLGLEFFCRETDSLWKKSEADLKALAQEEMHKIGLVKQASSLDAVVIRVPKAYPGYFGAAFERFDELRAGLDKIENLFLIGRNGMHRYNNQDHSMLTAKRAVELIVAQNPDKSSIWDINIDDDYHEQKK